MVEEAIELTLIWDATTLMWTQKSPLSVFIRLLFGINRAKESLFSDLKKTKQNKLDTYKPYI